jgi:phenylpyruvate tautomerase PptA (4-oxalocrotonate tautomerase family)
MPHVIVKLYSGRSEQQKGGIAEAVTKAIMARCVSACNLDPPYRGIGVQD